MERESKAWRSENSARTVTEQDAEVTCKGRAMRRGEERRSVKGERRREEERGGTAHHSCNKVSLKVDVELRLDTPGMCIPG